MYNDPEEYERLWNLFTKAGDKNATEMERETAWLGLKTALKIPGDKKFASVKNEVHAHLMASSENIKLVKARRAIQEMRLSEGGKAMYGKRVGTITKMSDPKCITLKFEDGQRPAHVTVHPFSLREYSLT